MKEKISLLTDKLFMLQLDQLNRVEVMVASLLEPTTPVRKQATAIEYEIEEEGVKTLAF